MSGFFFLSVVAHVFRVFISPVFLGVLRIHSQTIRVLLAHLNVFEEVSSLVLKEVIIQVYVRPDLSLSPIFVFPMLSGGLRVILFLQVSIQHPAFPDGDSGVHPPYSVGSELGRLSGLKDAYLHPVVPSRIPPGSTRFEPLCIGFFPSASKIPLGIFTRLVATLVAFFRRHGVYSHLYLDD